MKHALILVPTPCEKELPTEYGDYWTDLGMLTYYPNGRQWFFHQPLADGQRREPKFWYKKVENVHVLTYEEYTEQLKETRTQAYQEGRISTLSSPVTRIEENEFTPKFFPHKR